MPGGSKNSSENMYRVGDHVYFEMLATAPYQIRKLEELSQNPDGTVVARVSIYYRRQDLTTNLLQSLDKEQDLIDAEYFESLQNHSNGIDSTSSSSNNNILNNGQELVNNKTSSTSIHPSSSTPPIIITPALKDHLKLCEVFPSSRQEILHATHIRGKCQVIALAEDVETRNDFAEKENLFFFTRKYDPDKKTLKPPGEKIRVGSKWQADIPIILTIDSSNNKEVDLDNEKSTSTTTTTNTNTIQSPRQYEVPIFINNRLSNNLVDDFLILASAVGLYARAHDTATLLRDSCLLTATSRASRGVTKDSALAILHNNNYDLTKATSALFASNGQPIYFRDELEDWSPLEAQEFAKTLEKEGKCLADMKKNLFPWKEMSDIVAFYYFWKTTDRYAFTCQKQAINKTDTKLKQVFIPLYNRINPSVLYRKSDAPERPCDACTASSSPTWYSWTGNVGEAVWKLCRDCWFYWKKYGGLRESQKCNSIDKDHVAIESSGATNNGLINGLSLNKSTVSGDSIKTNIHDLTNNSTATTTTVVPKSSSGKTESFPCLLEGCKLVFRTQSTRDRHMSMVHRIINKTEDSVHVGNSEVAVVKEDSSCNNTITNWTPSNAHHSHPPPPSPHHHHQNHPLPATTTSSALPLSSCLFDVDRVGRNSLVSMTTMRKLGRCPTNPQLVTVTEGEISKAGLELCSAENKSKDANLFLSRSVMDVCNRLMQAKDMTATNANLIAALVTNDKNSQSSTTTTTEGQQQVNNKKRPFALISSCDSGSNGNNNNNSNTSREQQEDEEVEETTIHKNGETSNGNNLLETVTTTTSTEAAGHEENSFLPPPSTTSSSSASNPPPAKRPTLS